MPYKISNVEAVLSIAWTTSLQHSRLELLKISVAAQVKKNSVANVVYIRDWSTLTTLSLKTITTARQRSPC
jgi:hypothetical protein